MKNRTRLREELDQRRHDAAIEPGSPVLGLRLQNLGSFKMLAKQAQRGPGRDHKGHHQREEHGRRCAHGNGPHVRAHQSADKGHGQHRRDHGEGGQNGGVAHLGHRFHRDRAHRPAMILRKPEVAHHVLDHDDGVVHKNADGEDQGEERNAVDGVAQEIKHRHGERQRDRNGQQHHARLAPAQEERHQQGHRQRGQQQVLQQFIRLVFGRLSVIPRSGHGHVVGHGDALHLHVRA